MILIKGGVEMCEDENCDCHHNHKSHHHGSHHQKHHSHWKYSTIAKRTGESVKIPEILFEVANIEEGDFFEINIRKIKRNKH
jgi:hypothetical protein